MCFTGVIMAENVSGAEDRDLTADRCAAEEESAPGGGKRKRIAATCTVIAVILVAALVIGLVIHFGRIDAFTWELYERVERGMTYGEVCEVLDFEGELIDYDFLTSAATYVWNRGDRYVFVSFIDGEAVEKTQVNMENTSGYDE